MIDKNAQKYKETKKIKDIIDSYKVENFLNLTGALKMRYIVKAVTNENITRCVGEIRNRSGEFYNSIPLIVAFAKEEGERNGIISKIRELIKSDEEGIIFIDTSLCFRN